MFDRIIPGSLWFGCYYLGMSSAGFVLVGGKSSRMGRDKALLPWKERPLVEHIAHCVSNAAGSVTLVGSPDRYSVLNSSVIADSYLDCGPLGGIEAALSSDRSAKHNLIVACDLPDLALNATLLNRLVEHAKQTSAPCVAAQEPEGRIHPLCAVYRSDALFTIRQSLREGSLRLSELFERLNGVVWPVSQPLANVNSPEDWLAWQTT